LPPNGAPSAPTTSTVSPGAGACDFAPPGADDDTHAVFWTAAALPSVVAIGPLPDDLADPKLHVDPFPLGPPLAENGPELLIERGGSPFRLHIVEDPRVGACVLLPFDRLFEVRAAAALRLWRALAGRALGRDPAALPTTRRDRLVLALRALDGRLAEASYREIAGTLFGAARVPEHGWKTHDLRDRTARLVRSGVAMMQGGYRQLLLYPFRGRI
jgi:T6SS, Transcription factor, DNA binding domain